MYYSELHLLPAVHLHHALQLVRGVPQQGLQVTHKPIDIPLASCLMNDVLIVIISQASGQLLIVHLWLVFPHAPPPGNLVRVAQLELPPVPRPGDEGLAGLVREELQEELPQLYGTRSLIAS